VKFTGRIGVVGVFIPEDPGSEDKLGRLGKMPFDFGMF
jgi:glutathione-independent formaldehyde dehydrogenase